MGTESSPAIWSPAPNQKAQTLSSGNVAAAPITLTMPAQMGQVNYLLGFEITGAGATAASVILATITGLAGGSKTFAIAIPAGANVGIQPLIIAFPIPIPASSSNQAITLSIPSFGAGNTNAVANLQGFSQPG